MLCSSTLFHTHLQSEVRAWGCCHLHLWHLQSYPSLIMDTAGFFFILLSVTLAWIRTVFLEPQSEEAAPMGCRCAAGELDGATGGKWSSAGIESESFRLEEAFKNHEVQPLTQHCQIYHSFHPLSILWGLWATKLWTILSIDHWWRRD